VHAIGDATVASTLDACQTTGAAGSIEHTQLMTPPHASPGRVVWRYPLLSPEEAADALGVGRSRIYDLMRTRQLHSVQIGKPRRVPAAAVHAYVERLTEQDALA
jgi:excisionase family DNA binding protein